MSTEITILPSKDALPAMFNSSGDEIESLVAKIEKEALAFAFDVTTAKGRKDCRSLASNVSKSKTFLDKIGKDENEERNRLNKLVNAKRNIIVDRLDALRDTIKKPVEDWEEAEASRIQKHQVNLGNFDDDILTALNSADEIASRIMLIESTTVDDTWEEFEEEGHELKAAALKKYAADLSVAKEREAQAAELEALRAKQEQRDREDAERAEAEKARLADEQRKAEEDARQKQAAKDQAEAADRAAKQAAENAERERIEAENRHAQELAEAKQREESAAQAERDRIAEEQRKENEAAELRRQDEAARALAILNISKALSAVEPRTVKAMAEAMIDGKIPLVVVQM